MMSNVVLLFAAMVALGFLLVLAGRSQNRRVWGDWVCGNGGCRFRNRAHARFCARCGRPLARE
jgi:hypothetical protein